MYPHQSERLTAALEQAGVAALVGTTAANVAYISGFRSLLQTAVPGTEEYAVFTRRGTALVVPVADLAAVAMAAPAVDHVRCYGHVPMGPSGGGDPMARRLDEWARASAASPAEALTGVLTALGVQDGRVGVDEGGLTPPAWRRVVEHLRPLVVAEAADALAGARQVKGPWELECLQRALGIAEEAANAIIQSLEPGATERETALRVAREVITRGAEPHAVLVQYGDLTALPWIAPSDRPLRTGDLVRLDVGCVFRGYYASLGRTAVMGQPDDHQQRAYDAVQAGLEAALDLMRPGAPAGRVFEAAITATRKAGLADYDRVQIGHGIGLEPCERPTLAREESTTLAAGMVLRVEMAYWEPGWGGVQVKETVLVTARSQAVLNRSARGLVVLD